MKKGEEKRDGKRPGWMTSKEILRRTTVVEDVCTVAVRSQDQEHELTFENTR